MDEELHATLQQLAADLDDSYCTGWIVLSEWINGDGNKVLSARKSASLTPWAVAGMLQTTLYGETV